jgi:hypothetical protein
MQNEETENDPTMKTRIKLTALALLLSTLNPQLSTDFAQGSLTPPGAPVPTMKSLDQIEARTSIATAPFTITQPGSYYLTTNVSVSGGVAITIATNGVMLDLNGFTIFSTAPGGSGTAILLGADAARNITIQNGFIQGAVTNNGTGVYNGAGFASGVNYASSAPANIRISGLSISGCLQYGIYLFNGNSTLVESCTVRTVGNYGILASVIRGSSAADCGGTAIAGDDVSDSRGQSVGGTGISAATIYNSQGSSVSGTGISGNAVLNCYGTSGNGTGISATTAQNSYGFSSSGTALSVGFLAASCYGHTDGSGYGVYAPATANTCYGFSGSSDGVNAGIAIGCYGFSNTGVGLRASIGNSSYGSSEIVANKYNML